MTKERSPSRLDRAHLIKRLEAIADWINTPEDKEALIQASWALSETQRSTADRCNAAMVFKKDWDEADPEALEPWYSHWVGELTAQGLHAKADIATVLAILSKRLSG